MSRAPNVRTCGGRAARVEDAPDGLAAVDGGEGQVARHRVGCQRRRALQVVRHHAQHRSAAGVDLDDVTRAMVVARHVEAAVEAPGQPGGEPRERVGRDPRLRGVPAAGPEAVQVPGRHEQAVVVEGHAHRPDARRAIEVEPARERVDPRPVVSGRGRSRPPSAARVPLRPTRPGSIPDDPCCTVNASSPRNLRLSSRAMLRVLHCDDDKTFRFLVRAVLDSERDIDLAGEAADARACIDLAEELQPDVVLLDESMPIMSGLEAIPRIREVSPASRIIVLSSFPADELRERALGLGAAAFVEKHGIVGMLAEAVRDAAEAV